jgi:hypothetical protein
MSSYVDCPKCGSEFVVSEDMMAGNLRCPDCLQWVDAMGDFFEAKAAYAGYSGYGESEYDDYGYQEGYDY